VSHLVAFLNARLDEDEAAANEATPGSWYSFNSGHGDDWYVASRNYGQVSTGMHAEMENVEILMIERDHRDADFIARWDPARVLREVDAKRRILAEHRVWEPRWGCTRCREWIGGIPEKVAWPCPTVRALAAVYSDHPDCDPAWSPD
jgi:Family of unknown function (DUF6221)